MKHGAFNACRKCGYAPETNEDKARHLIATDHYLGRGDLERMGADIAAGHFPKMDPADVERLAKVIEENPISTKEVAGFFIKLALKAGLVILAVIGILWYFLSKP